MADVMKMLQAIQKDPELTKRFLEDPQSALKEQGFKTEGLTIRKTSDARDLRIERLKPGTMRRAFETDFAPIKELELGRLDVLDQLDPAAATICGSIGYVVCGSVGD